MLVRAFIRELIASTPRHKTGLAASSIPSLFHVHPLEPSHFSKTTAPIIGIGKNVLQSCLCANGPTANRSAPKYAACSGKFYRDLAAQGMKVRVGIQASGHARWFERLLSESQFELWIGDAAEIRTKRVRKQFGPSPQAAGSPVFIYGCNSDAGVGAMGRYRPFSTPCRGRSEQARSRGQESNSGSGSGP
jgi:hypothetical protein